MPSFIRILLFLAILFTSFSCARREQALYQRSQHERFNQDSSSPAALIAIKKSPSDTSQSITTSEPVLILADANNNIPVVQTSPAWEDRSITAPAIKKAIVDQTKSRQTKTLLRKSVLKKLIADNSVKTSGLAIAALVCGILSFFVLAVVLGPLSIIFGGLALSKIKKDPEMKGRGLAVAGLILGIIATVIIIIYLASR